MAWNRTSDRFANGFVNPSCVGFDGDASRLGIPHPAALGGGR
jgi:hypothetical protein